MRYRIRTGIILAMFGAATTAPGTGEAAADEASMRGFGAAVFKKELSTAENAIEDALAAYDTNLIKCRYHLSIAIHALEESSRLYEEGSRSAAVVNDAAEYLASLYHVLGARLEGGDNTSPQEIEWEKATVRRIAADVSSLIGPEEVMRPGIAEKERISEEQRNDLLRAKTGLTYAPFYYLTDAETCRRHVGYAAGALKRISQRYKKGSPQRDYAEEAAEYLVTAEERFRRRVAEGLPADPKEMAADTTKMERISADVSALLRGEEVDPFFFKPNFDLLREEVKNNEAAGKGDIQAQIEALRAEAARLNDEAEAVEAENPILEEKIKRAKEVVDWWKSLIGEDQAFLCPYR